MNKLLLTCLFAVVLLATSVSSHAADVTITPPAASGFVVKNAAGTLDRMRVQESGAVSFPDLTNAASADTTLCFVAATGRLGPCSASSVTRTLQGTIQKGPYIFGSNVWISELDASLNQNGKSYIVQTNSDYGNFDGPTITVNNVEMLGDGYYMDELTGGLSVGRLMLRAIVDLSVDAHPIINILTTIQTPRLKFLLKSGTAYAAAYSQSQREVISAFGINPNNIVGLGNLSQMNISGNRDQDAVLLSASVVLLKMAANSVVANPSSSSTAELSRLVSVIARDLEKDGVLNDAGIISARRTANTQINLTQVRTNVESYYASIGQTLSAPKFEEWVDSDGSGALPHRQVPATGISFTNVTDAEYMQVVTSNTATVSGIGAGVVASVTTNAGTTIIKNGVPLSLTTATVQDGDTLALRRTSSTFGQANPATLVVGSTSTAWQVTTRTPTIVYANDPISVSSGASGYSGLVGKYFAQPFIASSTSTIRYLMLSIYSVAPTSISIYSNDPVSNVPSSILATSSTFANYFNIPLTDLNAVSHPTASYGSGSVFFGSTGVPLTQGGKYWAVITYPAVASGQDMSGWTLPATTDFASRLLSVDGTNWTSWGSSGGGPGASTPLTLYLTN